MCRGETLKQMVVFFYFDSQKAKVSSRLLALPRLVGLAWPCPWPGRSAQPSWKAQRCEQGGPCIENQMRRCESLDNTSECFSTRKKQSKASGVAWACWACLVGHTCYLASPCGLTARPGSLGKGKPSVPGQAVHALKTERVVAKPCKAFWNLEQQTFIASGAA